MDEARKVSFGELLWADDAPGIRAREGEALLLPPALRGGGSHRCHNLARSPTKPFLIDDVRT